MITNRKIMNIIENNIKEKGISYAEVARRTNTSQSTISRYKNRSIEFPINK